MTSSIHSSQKKPQPNSPEKRNLRYCEVEFGLHDGVLQLEILPRLSNPDGYMDLFFKYGFMQDRRYELIHDTYAPDLVFNRFLPGMMRMKHYGASEAPRLIREYFHSEPLLIGGTVEAMDIHLFENEEMGGGLGLFSHITPRSWQ